MSWKRYHCCITVRQLCLGERGRKAKKFGKNLQNVPSILATIVGTYPGKFSLIAMLLSYMLKNAMPKIALRKLSRMQNEPQF